jgi:hypothetical protein
LQVCSHFALTCCNCSLKMYAVYVSATMATIWQATPCHNPQDHNVNSHCQENLIILHDFCFFSAKYVKPCSRNDPNLNECAKRHAKDVISYPGLAQGKLQGDKKQCNASDIPRQDSEVDPWWIYLVISITNFNRSQGTNDNCHLMGTTHFCSSTWWSESKLTVVCSTEGKRTLSLKTWRPWRRWKNIKNNLTNTGLEGVDWIHLARGRDQWRALVNTVINLPVP